MKNSVRILPRRETRGAVKVGLWPGGATCALFLSHDVDQIHDREFWRILADVNHTRRVVLGGEPGSVRSAVRRIGRALVAPKSAISDFETILEIEQPHGFRSTFFLLYDRYWARHGARYKLDDPKLRDIVRLLSDGGCEIGVHGGYYAFNDAVAYRESKKVVENRFGVEVRGIRNHMLRHEGPATWCSQAQAGFSYDATFGDARRFGPRDGHIFPFEPDLTGICASHSILVLPLTVMDTTVFRYLGLEGEVAFMRTLSAIEGCVRGGGLVSLLWHNNFFNEPEYRDWQAVYEAVLERMALAEPWCATGAEIEAWWRRRERIRILGTTTGGRVERITVTIPAGPEQVCLEVEAPEGGKTEVLVGEAQVNTAAGASRVIVEPLRYDGEVVLTLTGSR